MVSLLNSAGFLLVFTGSLLGLTFPLGKYGAQAGIPPMVWAWLMSSGAAMGLLLYRIVTKQALLINGKNLQFYFIAAIVSLVVPNLLTYSVIPKLGSGFTGLLFTLSPLITLALSSVWQVHMPARFGLVGIAFGFVGAVIVAITRGELGHPASLIWILAGLAIPTTLAIGNVYRTMAWPKNAEPMELAIGMNLAAASMLTLLIMLSPTAHLPGGLQTIFPMVLLTVIVASVFIAFHSRLQFVGGPTYLSQMGYVAAAVALLVGTVVYKENYSILTWVGAGIIVIGAGFSVLSQRQTN